MTTNFAIFGIRGDFEEITKATQLAERVGIDGVLFGEHHGSARNQFPALLNLLSALAARTERVQLGTSILLSALYNPVWIAEEAAQVDVISKGRLILGLGLGYQPGDFSHFAVPFANRVSLFEEGVEVIRRAWTERPFSFVGKRHRFRSVSVFPVPVQRPHPPIWLAGWTVEGVKRAARLGDAWVTDPIQNLAGLQAMAACYAEMRAARGLPPRTVLMREILIDRSRSAALEHYGPGLLETYRYYWNNQAFNVDWDPWARSITSAADITLEDVIRDRVIAGSPDECTEQLKRWVADTGAEYVQLVIPSHQGASSTNLEAIELIGREVLPAFKG